MENIRRAPALTGMASVILCCQSIGQPPGNAGHPPLTDLLHIEFRIEGGGEPMIVDVPLDLASPAEASELDQIIALPAPLQRLRVKRYIPRAEIEQTVTAVKGEGGHAAVEISIDGPSRSFQRWFVDGDAGRNRLSSFIANWRYMAVADETRRADLFSQFESELTRPPVLRIRRSGDDVVERVSVEAGAVRALERWESVVRVKRFFPHFAMDDATGKPTNVSERRVNPAALVEIEHGADVERRWVFAKFPDYRAEEAALPFEITLDCPAAPGREVPEFVLVTVGGEAHEVWLRERGKVVVRTLSARQPVAIPGSRYTFQMTRFVPAGALVERYRPSSGDEGVTVIQVVWGDAPGDAPGTWVVLGKPGVISTPVGPMSVRFGPKGADGGGRPTWSH